jgi:DNA helicase-2/ATP-dependent DNA helicase PcrA
VNEFLPRRDQQKALAYEGGKMGISAVPGSGKTRTLAELAAHLVAERIDDGQEVLVVTLVNSAVDNFKSRINEAVKRRGLLTNFGYRVRTLHGLAHDIVRERPGLVGLSEDFAILDEREADAVRDEAVESWLRTHPDSFDPYLSLEVEGKSLEWVKRSGWPALARDIALAIIKRAKDSQITPEVLLARLAAMPDPASLPLAKMGAEIYADYQRSLAYRGAVDFDDLIRLALLALQRDADYLARLQRRWPYVLEDEAQDSSELQEKILRLLVGHDGNWVRVGDPNQAIYETFTNADPRFLKQYLAEPDVQEVTLPESGRSQLSILEMANYLVDWTYDEHPTSQVRGSFWRQYIRPTSAGDPQSNPDTDPAAVQLIDRDLTPDSELVAVADSLQGWLAGHEDWTVAVLVPRNQRGFELTDLLKKRGIDHVELLRSTSVTRRTAGALGNILRCLADPTSSRRLADAFRVWRRDDRDDAQAKGVVDSVAKRIHGCPAVEAYLWPRADHDWLASLDSQLPGEQMERLVAFREVVRGWHRATILPIDQLILTLAADLFHEPTDLALAHKLAILLRDVATAHPTWRLTELVEELAVIARNERRFLGFSTEDTAFDPPKGKVTVCTLHKAKGLEWDRVYLMSVNNYDFPSGLAHDTYIAERWFVRDSLNLEAEALGQLQALVDASEDRAGGTAIHLVEGAATRQARWDYVGERLRLLYVGITRARKDLIVTWNTGRRAGQKLQQAAPLIALSEYWQERMGREIEADA